MSVTKQELDTRRMRFCAAMEAAYPHWNTAVILSRVNQYYFTGTMQDALLIIRKDGAYAFFVKKSFRRASMESPLTHIFSMSSYRDAAETVSPQLGNVYIDAETAPYSMVKRIQKHFQMDSIGNLETVVREVRAVKSPYELFWMERSGAQHHALLTEDVPALLREGMTEAAFVGEVIACMMKREYHGITRFSNLQAEMIAGQFGFGDNSLYPTCFDGPGGSQGWGAGAPVAGNPDRRLKKGDLVFVDIGFGMNGYHSDKTQVYMFGAHPTDLAKEIHMACWEAERRAAEQLKPGVLPSAIYADCLAHLPPCLQEGFMGYADHCVKFLGHGVGLHVDELPVLAQGFDKPLEENMVISLEPKKGLTGVGMLGVEDTYVVTPEGGRCITGGGREIMVVD